MNDRVGGKAQQFLRTLRRRRIKTWQLVALLIILLLMSGYFLRHNNLQMVRLRNAVVQADERGGDVARALKELNHHVFHHMNTEIVRPIELVGTYERAAEAVIAAATRTSSPNIYTQATKHCEQQGVLLTSIAQCASEYIMRNKPDNLEREIVLPDKNRFIYTFASPLWTPDMAGFSLLAALVLALWVLARAFEYAAVKLVIRSRTKRSF